MGIRTWTDEELGYLRASYGMKPYTEIRSELSPHTVAAIGRMANKIGLRANRGLSAALARTGHRGHFIDCEYFSTVNTQSCYWAGFIAADGNISQVKHFAPMLKIGLSRKDKAHLAKLKESLKFGGEVKDTISKCNGKEFPTCRLEARISHAMAKDLEVQFGITPKKSLTLKPPKLRRTDQVASFIVGYIDGDGSIDWSERDRSFRIGIRGTSYMLEWIRDWFDVWFPISRMSKVGYSEKHPKYQVCGERAVNISRFLLKHSPNFMERKWGSISAVSR